MRLEKLIGLHFLLIRRVPGSSTCSICSQITPPTAMSDASQLIRIWFSSGCKLRKHVLSYQLFDLLKESVVHVGPLQALRSGFGFNVGVVPILLGQSDDRSD
ncbi:hypothetical protein P9112_014676 [Eukaryota sp. TZLM1-RC]